MLPVADSVPDLNVEQVCDGIAKQGGVTFRDPAVAREWLLSLQKVDTGVIQLALQGERR